ncbi:unnamed protein product [Orchesella dallaii]|uniref:Uncharacterized protein n=1 Tax=Orchesella dallaii TaxID=48710 RepID=A0ABP1QUP6_9HEXA
MIYSIDYYNNHHTTESNKIRLKPRLRVYPKRYLFLVWCANRPGLEPPVIQKASFDEFTYDVDVSRNVAAKTRTCDKDKLSVGGDDQISNLYRSMPALNRIASTESEPENNPEMVAGRLEIRVVSQPVPPCTEDKPDVISNVPPGVDGVCIPSSKSSLQQVESVIAIQEDGQDHLPDIHMNGGADVGSLNPPSNSQPKALKSILKNKSDSSIGEKAIRIENKLTVKQDLCDENEKLETPDIIASNPECPHSKGQSVAEEYHSARTQLPEHATEERGVPSHLLGERPGADEDSSSDSDAPPPVIPRVPPGEPTQPEIPTRCSTQRIRRYISPEGIIRRD